MKTTHLCELQLETYLGLELATALSSLDPELPFVARLLLLLLWLLPPPGPGPLGAAKRSLHFLIRFFARPASDLSVVFFLSWLICFPSLVPCKQNKLLMQHLRQDNQIKEEVRLDCLVGKLPPTPPETCEQFQVHREPPPPQPCW